VDAPLFIPLQEAFVLEKVQLGPPILFTITLEVAEHPVPPVTVTV
jgi:hypothetical protein